MTDRIATMDDAGSIVGHRRAYSLEITSPGQPGSGLDTAWTSERTLAAVKTLIYAPGFGSVPAAHIQPTPIGYLFRDSAAGGTTKGLWYAHHTPDNMESLGLSNITVPGFAVAVGQEGDLIFVNAQTGRVANPWVAPSGTPLSASSVDAYAQNESKYPVTWLGTAGASFGIDESGEEYFMFAEYTTADPKYVWKVTKPYTTATNWTRVLAVPHSSAIHLHSCQFDPWTRTWYVTSGDLDARTMWWRSTDHGATWTKFVDGSTSGWPSQVGRTCGLIFTEDYVYWANDNATNHGIYRLPRAQNGLIDFTGPPVKLAALNPNQASYATILLDRPAGLLILDRVDALAAATVGTLEVEFYEFATGTLHSVATIDRRPDATGAFGFRCRAYVLHQGRYEDRVLVGFGDDYPNNMDLPGNEGSRRTTLALRVVPA